MASASGRFMVTYNGEIYNHLELRRTLDLAGHRLASDADGEVISYLYDQDPAGFASKLDGMFAIAIVDEIEAEEGTAE